MATVGSPNLRVGRQVLRMGLSETEYRELGLKICAGEAWSGRRTMFFARGGFYLHPPTPLLSPSPFYHDNSSKKNTLRKNGTIHR